MTASTSLLTTAGRITHRLLRHHGLDADALYIECGLDPLKLDSPKARYPLERTRALWRLADKMIQDPCWGLGAGEVWRPTDFHALGYAFLASRTLEAALLRLERYFRIVVLDGRLRLSTNQDDLQIAYLPSPGDQQQVPSLEDARWSVILRMCRDVYGRHLPLREVHLFHGWQACAYEQFFGCPLRYEADRSALTLPRDVAHQILPAANRDLARESDRILSGFHPPTIDRTLAARVRAIVRDKLAAGRPSAKEVARELALAPRTLQRKLQEEGTTFHAAADEVRKERAIQYVREGKHDLSEVTYLTGFSNLSAFSRAYKAWTGRSPSEDRRKD